MTVIWLVQVPETDTVGSAHEIVVVVTVDGGRVEREVDSDWETELETIWDEPNKVDVGEGVHAIAAKRF